jgi:small GTP-binding protein
MSREQYEAYKVVLIGQAEVGKTSLRKRCCEGKYSDKYEGTIGADFSIKVASVSSKQVRIQIWDMGGQERFKNLIPAYVRGSDAIIVVFAIDDKDSFEYAQELLKKYQDEYREAHFVLVGTKSDNSATRKVPQKEAIETNCLENSIKYYETSAKDDVNVKELFEETARAVYDNKHPHSSLSVEHPESITNESTDPKAKLITRLETYTQKKAEQRDGDYGYLEGFWCIWGFFGHSPQSRAENRAMNHTSAQDFLKELIKPEATVPTVFTNVEKVGFFLHHYKVTVSGKEHHISRSSELHGIIDDAKTSMQNN